MDADRKEETEESECARLCSMIVSMKIDHVEATRVLEALHGETDVQDAFSGPNRKGSVLQCT